MEKKFKALVIVLLCVVLTVTLYSCGVKVDEAGSPRLKSVSIDSYSNDTENSQYVAVDLIFDRDIAVMEDKCESLRITIADMRVQEDEYTLEKGDDNNTARLVISVNAITKGVLNIRKEKEDSVISEIRSSDEKYAAADFTVEGIIPSGVTLSTTESEPGRVVKTVDNYWNIRSIAWVGLTENGKLIPVSETRYLEMLDGYAAVHGHEFLMENEEDIAANITEVLQNNYDSGYSFSCEGNRITAEKPGSDVELDIVIYTYLKVNGKQI